MNYFRINTPEEETMISFTQSNFTIVNSTFENNLCGSLIISQSNSEGVWFGNLISVKITENLLKFDALIFYQGIINFVFDNFEFKQNQGDYSGLIISKIFGGSIIFLNSFKMSNNLGKFCFISIIFFYYKIIVYNLIYIYYLRNMDQIDFKCSLDFINNTCFGFFLI